MPRGGRYAVASRHARSKLPHSATTAMRCNSMPLLCSSVRGWPALCARSTCSVPTVCMSASSTPRNGVSRSPGARDQNRCPSAKDRTLNRRDGRGQYQCFGGCAFERMNGVEEATPASTGFLLSWKARCRRECRQDHDGHDWFSGTPRMPQDRCDFTSAGRNSGRSCRRAQWRKTSRGYRPGQPRWNIFSANQRCR